MNELITADADGVEFMHNELNSDELDEDFEWAEKNGKEYPNYFFCD